jgi:hypothetical protein
MRVGVVAQAGGGAGRANLVVQTPTHRLSFAFVGHDATDGAATHDGGHRQSHGVRGATEVPKHGKEEKKTEKKTTRKKTGLTLGRPHYPGWQFSQKNHLGYNERKGALILPGIRS